MRVASQLFFVIFATSCVVDGGEDPEPGPTTDELVAICQDVAVCLPASCVAETQAQAEHIPLEPEDEEDEASAEWLEWNDELHVLSDARWDCIEATCYGAVTREEVNAADNDLACPEGQRLDEACAVALGVRAVQGIGWCDVYLD